MLFPVLCHRQRRMMRIIETWSSTQITELALCKWIIAKFASVSLHPLDSRICRIHRVEWMPNKNDEQWIVVDEMVFHFVFLFHSFGINGIAPRLHLSHYIFHPFVSFNVLFIELYDFCCAGVWFKRLKHLPFGAESFSLKRQVVSNSSISIVSCWMHWTALVHLKTTNGNGIAQQKYECELRWNLCNTSFSCQSCCRYRKEMEREGRRENQFVCRCVFFSCVWKDIP